MPLTCFAQNGYDKPMPQSGILYGLVAISAGLFLSGLLAKKLNQPIILGYLFAGLGISSFLDKFGWEKSTVSFFAQIGLSLLMFSLGLEFSLKKIEKIKEIVIIGAILQILLTVLFGSVLLSLVLGLDFLPSVVMAMAFSLSSTAIIIKILKEKNILDSLSGDIMEGWLLIQDLAVLPMIAILPIMLGINLSQTNPFNVFLNIVFLIATGVFSYFLVPKLADYVSSFNNRELLLIFSVFLFFLFTAVFSLLGLPLALGAFVAGLILRQTFVNNAVFSEIRPLRDIFLAIFFVSLGLSLQGVNLLSQIPSISLVLILFLVLKTFLIGLVIILFGFHAKTIFEISFGLSTIGEFSFVLASAAASQGLLGPKDYSLTTSVTLLSMVLTPGMFFLSNIFYKKSSVFLKKFPGIYKKFYSSVDRRFDLEDLPLENHIIIIGYGRVGKWIGHVLESSKIDFLVIENNPLIIRTLKLEGKKVVFGDPTELSVLDFARVDKARLVIVAIPDFFSQKMVISNVRSLNKKVTIICRSHLDEDNDTLKLMGAEYVVYPEFEAALSISHRVLQIFGREKEEIINELKKLRKSHSRQS